MLSQQLSAASKATPYWGFSLLEQLSLLSVPVSGRQHSPGIAFKRENGSLEPESCTEHHVVSFALADSSQVPGTTGMLIPNGLSKNPETSLVRGGSICSCTWVTSSDRGERKKSGGFSKLLRAASWNSGLCIARRGPGTTTDAATSRLSPVRCQEPLFACPRTCHHESTNSPDMKPFIQPPGPDPSPTCAGRDMRVDLTSCRGGKCLETGGKTANLLLRGFFK